MKSTATGIAAARMGLPNDKDGGEYGGVQLRRP